MKRIVLRKTRIGWVAASLLLVSLGVTSISQVNADEAQQVKVEAKLDEENRSEFKEKSVFLEDEWVQAEIQRAIDRSKDVTQPTTVEDIVKEIVRQVESQEQAQVDYPIYIVQAGDQLENLAAALEIDEEDIAEKNQLDLEKPLVVGDIIFTSKEEAENEHQATLPHRLVASIKNNIVNQPNSHQSKGATSQTNKPQEKSHKENKTPVEQTTEKVSETTIEQENKETSKETVEEEKSESTVAPETTIEDVTDEETSVVETTVEESSQTTQEESKEEETVVETTSETSKEEVSQEDTVEETTEESSKETTVEEKVETPVDTTVETEVETPIETTEDTEPEVIDETVEEEIIDESKPTPEDEVSEPILTPIPNHETLEDPNPPMNRTETIDVVETVEEMETVTVVEQEEVVVPGTEVFVFDENGNQVFDELGNPVTEKTPDTVEIRDVTKEVQKPVIKEITKKKTVETIYQPNFSTEILEPMIETIEDNTLLPSQSYFKVQPVQGKRVIFLYNVFVNGEMLEPLQNGYNEIPAINGVWVQGTKKEPVVTVKQVTTTQTISPLADVIKEDPTLAEGQVVIEQEGQAGTRVIVEEVTLTDGKETNRKVISNQITLQPTATIKRIGTKKADTVEHKQERQTVTSTDKIQTETRNNPELAQGEERIIQKGSQAVIEITYDVTFTNGQETDRQEVSRRVIKEATPTIIEVGTKKADVITTKEIVETIESVQPIVVEKRDNPNLAKGKEQTIQEGQIEIVDVTYKVTYTNGQETSKEEVSRKVVQEAKPTIIEVGTKVVEGPDHAQVGETIGDITVLSEPISGTQIRDAFMLTPEERYELAMNGDSLMGKIYHSLLDLEAIGTIPITNDEMTYANQKLDKNLLNQEMIALVNNLRIERGLNPLKISESKTLHDFIEERKEDMDILNGTRIYNEDGTYEAHVDRYGNAIKYPKEIDYTAAGENIAMFGGLKSSQITSEKFIATVAFNMWKNSPGHLANMLGENFTEMAFGIFIDNQQTGYVKGEGVSTIDTTIIEAVQVFIGN